jgi:hypothetical protein
MDEDCEVSAENRSAIIFCAKGENIVMIPPRMTVIKATLISVRIFFLVGIKLSS